jgi:hypothetical protein
VLHAFFTSRAIFFTNSPKFLPVLVVLVAVVPVVLSAVPVVVVAVVTVVMVVAVVIIEKPTKRVLPKKALTLLWPQAQQEQRKNVFFSTLAARGPTRMGPSLRGEVVSHTDPT